uniref:Uncharacterized protein n=1 Tax=Biomphalaria glabrata TaxID=6526 RepID=A0A2C9JL37_BIOGL
MAETKDKRPFDDSSLFRTIASASSSEIEQFLRLCDSKSTDFSNHALNWAVLQACNIGHAHLLQFLLQDGTRLELRDDNGNTSYDLLHARFSRHCGYTSGKSNKGANINFKTITTTLIYAVSWDYFLDIKLTSHPQLRYEEIEEKILPVIDLYLKNGANLEDYNNHGCTALMESVKGYFSAEVLKYLLHTGTDLNRKDDEGFTALHGAATHNKLDFAEALLKYGAIVNLKSLNGRTPLHEAVEDVNITKLFLENQAKVNAKDKNGDTPLSLASKHPEDMVDVVKLLIVSGADVNHKNNSGMSPLWLAAKYFKIKCLESLIEAKADLSHDDQQQKSALSILLNDWSPSGQCQQTALILMQHGASAEFVRFDVIHRLIAAGNDGILIQKLIKSRFCPTDIILKSPVLNWQHWKTGSRRGPTGEEKVWETKANLEFIGRSVSKGGWTDMDCDLLDPRP